MNWSDQFSSPAPSVRLVDQIEILKEHIQAVKGAPDISERERKRFSILEVAMPILEGIAQNEGYHTAIAAASSCYAGDLVNPLAAELTNPEKTERIAKSTWEARHHTPYMHKHYTFRMDAVSRQALWSFFHQHPFYNSEQVSQRYKKMAATKGETPYAVIPKLQGEAQEVFTKAIELQFALYNQFRDDVLRKAAEDAYFRIFPGRKTTKNESIAKKARLDIGKKTQEVARYFLPIGTHAHLYHTVNTVTLARYHRLANQPDVPLEVAYIVQQMVNEALRRDPKLSDLLEAPIPKEELLENKVRAKLNKNPELTKEFLKEFDARLEYGLNPAAEFVFGSLRQARLISYKQDAIPQMAAAVRDVLGLPKSSLSDEEALKLVLDPSFNRQRGDVLTLDHVQKLTRVKNIPHFTFLVKLSHTADSQAQRQRMSPASRPILEEVVTDEPDFITPALVLASGDEAVKRYEEGMQLIWDHRNRLIKLGVPEEMANYLLPNAVAIRYRESVDLLNFMQKDEKRECLNAQEEISRITVEQRQDIEAAHPELKGFFGPPCYLRKTAGMKPPCPEGDRYCGVPVWRGLEQNEDGTLKNPELTIEHAVKTRVI